MDNWKLRGTKPWAICQVKQILCKGQNHGNESVDIQLDLPPIHFPYQIPSDSDQATLQRIHDALKWRHIVALCMEGDSLASTRSEQAERNFAKRYPGLLTAGVPHMHQIPRTGRQLLLLRRVPTTSARLWCGKEQSPPSKLIDTHAFVSQSFLFSDQHSSHVFLQDLRRSRLKFSPKFVVCVIDLVHSHASFLLRPRRHNHHHRQQITKSSFNLPSFPPSQLFPVSPRPRPFCASLPGVCLKPYSPFPCGIRLTLRQRKINKDQQVEEPRPVIQTVRVFNETHHQTRQLPILPFITRPNRYPATHSPLC